jgi:hypothetical protein
MEDDDEDGEMMERNKKGRKQQATIQTQKGDNSMLAQVVGIIIGSPEFQRR